MEEKKDYKSTLLMPQTDFEMKGKLPTKEPLIQEKWDQIDLYQLMLKERENAQTFILHDGPPYANGNIHIGHALNKILKDFVVRSKNLQGYKTPYIPGWDTHGLPIETAITKSGINRKEYSVADFRKLCEEYALKQIEGQSAQFQRLGSLGDYKNKYATLDKELESHQIKIFGKMALDGLIYRGLRPVYWSPSSETALAEAEIEYHDKRSSSVYVKFNVRDGKNVLSTDDSIVIWTTTCWSLPGNVAISVHPEVTYGVYACSYGNLVIAKDLAKTFFEKIEVSEYNLTKEVLGKDLEFVETTHPLYDRKSTVILGEHVTTTDGTGCVHTAPGHGEDDFQVCRKYNIEVFCPVDDRGCMTKEAGADLEGVFYDEANKIIVSKLEANNSLIKLDFITHSYPHDWRTKKPVIYRATDQWFASIAKIRDELLTQIDNVNWVPTWGHTRLYNMIRDRGDWCISRQRYWGVPIPIIYDENHEPLLEKEIFDHVSELFLKHGSNVWFEKDVMELLPASFLEKTTSKKFTKETDTMDVWFDSGSSHTGVLVARNLPYPADLYLEGSDQYRGWFNSSLIVGTAYHQQAPYKQVLSHGFVLDGKGNKMSKSIGNVIDPLKMINQYGADILRFWVASVDYQSDVRISEDMLKQVSDSYRKVRNTYKFILGNLFDFNDSMLLDIKDLEEVDQYMIAKLNNLITKVTSYYNNYEFNLVYTTINNFIVRQLSSFYLDFIKDITYILKNDDLRRRQVQTVLYHTLNTLNTLLAPFLPHTSEEVYGYLDKANKKQSIHLEVFANTNNFENEKAIEDKFDNFMLVRDDILKALEVARENKIIGKSLEAKVEITLKDEYQFVKDIKDLAQVCIVSNLEIVNDQSLDEYSTSYIKITKYEGHTCPRCWNVVETSTVVDDLCQRCHSIINR